MTACATPGCGHDEDMHSLNRATCYGVAYAAACTCAGYMIGLAEIVKWVEAETREQAEKAAAAAWSRMGVEFIEGKRHRDNLPDWGYFAPAFIAGYMARDEVGE